MRYTIVLEQEPDGGYVGSVPALPGCVSQGDNRTVTLSNIREAIELYVEDCRDACDPVPTEVGKEFVEVEAADAGGFHGAAFGAAMGDDRHLVIAGAVPRSARVPVEAARDGERSYSAAELLPVPGRCGR